MTGEEHSAAALRDALISGDGAAACRLIDGSRLPLPEILRGLALAASRQGAPGGIPAGAFVDAVRDLAPTYAGDAPHTLFEGAVSHLTAHPFGGSRPESLLLQEGDTLEVVAVSELEEALVEGEFDDALRVCGRLLSVIRSKESFLENVLEIAAPQPDPWVLVHATAAVKTMHDMSGEPLREVVYALVRDLAGREIEPVGRPASSTEPVAWDALFRAAMQNDESLESSAPFLACAFQAQRYAAVKRGRILGHLRARFDAVAPAWRAVSDDGDDTTPTKTGENLTAVDQAAGSALSRRLIDGDASAAREIVRAWWGRVEDPDPLFRWIAEAALAKGTPGDLGPLVFVNGCRWGAHLMKGRGLRLTERVLERVAAMSAEGGDS